MNNRRDKTNSTNRVRTLMLCAFAFIVLSGLMVFTKYTELRDAERHEQRILGHERLITDHVHRVKTSQREIKAHRSEIEAQQREAVQLLKKINGYSSTLRDGASLRPGYRSPARKASAPTQKRRGTAT